MKRYLTVFSHFTMLLALSYSPAAMAYISPGPGLTMIGSLLALVASIGVALFMVLLWPIRRYYKRRQTRRETVSGQNGHPNAKP